MNDALPVLSGGTFLLPVCCCIMSMGLSASWLLLWLASTQWASSKSVHLVMDFCCFLKSSVSGWLPRSKDNQMSTERDLNISAHSETMTTNPARCVHASKSTKQA